MRRSHLIAPVLSFSLVAAVAAPRPLRRAACLALLSYLLAVLATAGRAARRPGQRTEGALLVGVLPAIHFGWGFGTLAGMLRFGPPLKALTRLLGRTDTSTGGNETEPVHAPSLHDEGA